MLARGAQSENSVVQLVVGWEDAAVVTRPLAVKPDLITDARLFAVRIVALSR